jgi:hypothetical protein
MRIEIVKDTATPLLLAIRDRAAGSQKAPIASLLEMGLADARVEIESQGDHLAGGWPGMNPLTPFIYELLKGRDHAGSLLQADGALLASLSKDAAGNIFEVGDTEGEAGTSAPGAGFVQDGTSTTFFVLQFLRSGKKEWGGSGIPGRKFLFWSEQRLSDYERVYLDHFMQPVGAESESASAA